ncbi:set-domain histone methyltransferase-8 [Colletotrichum kahawae]|uniref:Set-domain histone methyltransferase-8 n=1 Tax=Colletotrichum kahawae TaxID=34407 RepID=A0AAD9YNY2_COLKA|nr:set-domain histone methyltransferase-8 [Colletotrichum kahawae]
MHIEDLAVPSVNLVRWGAPKKWLFITPEPGNVRNFENKCRKTFPHRKCVKHRHAQPECSQFVRHSNALFSTEALREWGIKFTETTCQEGEMVVTLPGTYHQVVNEGENLAEAVNVMWSGCSEVPMAYAYCSRNLCGHSGSISQDDLAPRMRSLQD